MFGDFSVADDVFLKRYQKELSDGVIQLVRSLINNNQRGLEIHYTHSDSYIMSKPINNQRCTYSNTIKNITNGEKNNLKVKVESNPKINLKDDLEISIENDAQYDTKNSTNNSDQYLSTCLSYIDITVILYFLRKNTSITSLSISFDALHYIPCNIYNNLMKKISIALYSQLRYNTQLTNIELLLEPHIEPYYASSQKYNISIYNSLKQNGMLKRISCPHYETLIISIIDDVKPFFRNKTLLTHIDIAGVTIFPNGEDISFISAIRDLKYLKHISIQFESSSLDIFKEFVKNNNNITTFNSDNADDELNMYVICNNNNKLLNTPLYVNLLKYII